MAKKTAPKKGAAASEPVEIHEPEVVGSQPINADHGLVLPEMGKLGEWTRGMVTFFTKASQLEAAAKGRLEKAKAMKAPTNADEDEQVQLVLREAKMGRKATDDHWSITGLLSKLHKATVAGRERAGKMDDEAAEIAQRIHNRYVDDAKRKAREEEDRINREREEQARQDRERELAKMEEEALQREAAMEGLSEREEQFVARVAEGVAPMRAAGAVGYKNAEKEAARLMALPKVKVAIEAKRQADAIRRQAAAKREMPVQVERETVAVDVRRAAGVTGDRTTWSGEVLDERAFVEAAVGGKHGIPLDCLTVNQAKLTEYARALHERLDLWPGVRAKKNTSTV